MARYRLSKAADAKLADIYEYSILQLGEQQADEYFVGLIKSLELLAGRPYLGHRDYSAGDTIRRFTHRQHVIYYCRSADGIFVIDLFGVRQLPRMRVRTALTD